MAEGDPVTKGTGDDGVAMIEGDPAETVGPEDAAGHGVKRGDYSDRTDHPTKPHSQVEVTRDATTNEITDVDKFDQTEVMTESTPGVPQDGEKGGVGTRTEGEFSEPDSYDAPEDEVQTITVDATSFTVTFDGETTGSLTKATTNGAEVQTALEGLSNINPGDVSVTGPDGGPYVVTFGGQYEGENVPEMTGTGTGGAASVVVTTGTQGGS